MSKIKIFLFLPECYGDTRIVTFFNIGRGFINHAEGIHKVAKAMKSQVRDYHKILIDLVDNDKKNVPSYFNDFVILKETQSLILRH
jgi:hypothetical protein